METEEFEWDDRKAADNLRKHGTYFESATFVFDDDGAIDHPDTSQYYGEDRNIITGMVGDRLLTVVYTVREGRYRIISARPASKTEHDDYYRQNPPV